MSRMNMEPRGKLKKDIRLRREQKLKKNRECFERRVREWMKKHEDET